MTQPLDPQQSIEAEIGQLRQRLDEIEDMARAISGGEVDAFVVGTGERDKRVLLLAGAYQRYRQLVERMAQGALTVSDEGAILYANHRFAAMLGVPMAQIFSTPLQSFVSVADRERLSDFLATSARNSRIELDFNRRDGLVVPVRLSLASFADGYASILATELQDQEWARVAERSLNLMRAGVEILNRTVTGDTDARRALDTIAREVNGLSRLLDDLNESDHPS
jgi:PAS domain S-box-containing protein